MCEGEEEEGPPWVCSTGPGTVPEPRGNGTRAGMVPDNPKHMAPEDEQVGIDPGAETFTVSWHHPQHLPLYIPPYT